MKKQCLILLSCFLLLFLSSCEIINKTSGSDSITDDKPGEITKEISINRSSNQANGARISFDSKKIYYANDGKLYSINKDGKNKKVLFDKYEAFGFEIYKDRIYIEYKNNKNYGICSINMDGSDVKYIDIENLNLMGEHWYRGFRICHGYIYYYFGNYYGGSNPEWEKELYLDCNKLYRYNIENGKIDDLNIFFGDASLPIVYNDKLYLHDEQHLDKLIEIDGDKINFIEYRLGEHKEYGVSSLQVNNEYFYYLNSKYIYRNKLINAEKTEIVLEVKGMGVEYMNVTKEYIFFTKALVKEGKVVVQIDRMKHDGTELKTIFEDVLERARTHVIANPIYIVDNLVFYRLGNSGEIKAMDFDGNIFDWDL